MIYLYKTLRGLEIECELEYEPRDENYPPQAFLLRALVAGQDISDVMDNGLIEKIEEAAAWSMQD